jgi:glycerol uptake facilitator-like aquaporin
MNDQLQKVLADLAAKFGTSVEHLWKVMIYQARISVLVDLLQYLILAIIGVVLIIAHKRFMKKIPGNRCDNNSYEEYDAVTTIMAILAVGWTIGVAVAFFSLGDTLTAALNPEYWALKQILNK